MSGTGSVSTSSELRPEELESAPTWPGNDAPQTNPVSDPTDLPGNAYQQMPLSRSVEMRAAFYQTLLTYIKQITKSEINIEASRSFKTELSSVLEGFARVLRSDCSVPISEHEGAEVEELRRELVESKDKIITLLTDRAKDQVHIAKLETELKFLPELQAQADRALSLANDTGSLHEELTKVRFELNKAHLSRMRSKLHRRRRNRSWWSHIRAHFLPEETE